MIYQWRKGIATWVNGQTLNISVPFTWLMEDAERLAKKWPGKVLIGGPGTMKFSQMDDIEPILFHNPCATFTTRGCVNSCRFCAVPEIEGKFREIRNFRSAPVICDNNFLAASVRHIEWVMHKLRRFPIIDFNQGLEARRFTPEIADILGKSKCKIRFAFDSWGQESAVKDAIDLCRERSTKDIGVYCLIGYNDTPKDAEEKLELIRSWGVLPNPMRFQPLDAKRKNNYVHPWWTEKKLADTMKYYSRLIWYGHIPFKNFESKQDIRQLNLEV